MDKLRLHTRKRCDENTSVPLSCAVKRLIRLELRVGAVRFAGTLSSAGSACGCCPTVSPPPINKRVISYWSSVAASALRGLKAVMLTRPEYLARSETYRNETMH